MCQLCSQKDLHANEKHSVCACVCVCVRACVHACMSARVRVYVLE